MGFLSRAIAERKSADPLAVWADILRKQTGSKAGVTINLQSALKVSVFFACLRKIS